MKMNVILPTRFLQYPSVLKKVVSSTMTGAAKGVQADFDSTTATWKSRPTFAISSPSTHVRRVQTDNLIYLFVDQGTRPHPINPRNGKALRFQGGFSAKTSIRAIGSSAGGSSGPFSIRRSVMHPGTQAREFADAIREKWEAELPRIMQAAIDSEV